MSVIHLLLASAVVLRTNADSQAWNTGNYNRGGYNYGANRTSSCGRKLFESVTVTVRKNGKVQSLLGCRYEANSVERNCPDPYDGLDEFLEHIYEGIQPYARGQGRPITSPGSCGAQSGGGYTSTTIPITAYITLVRSRNKGSSDKEPSVQGYDYRPKRGRYNWDLVVVQVLLNGVPIDSLFYSNAPSYLYPNAPQRFTTALDSLIDFEERFPPESAQYSNGGFSAGFGAPAFDIRDDGPPDLSDEKVSLIMNMPYKMRGPLETQGSAQAGASPPAASYGPPNNNNLFTSYSPPISNHSNTFSSYRPSKNTNRPPITSYGPPNPSKTNSVHSYVPPENSKAPHSNNVWQGPQQSRPTNQWQSYS